MELSSAQLASKLRKRMHVASFRGDGAELDDAMSSLYDCHASPILDSMSSKVAFGPIVEACALCILQKHDTLSKDMLNNVRYLHSNFGLNQYESDVLVEALQRCSRMSMEEAGKAMLEAGRRVGMEDKVNICRHARHFHRSEFD